MDELVQDLTSALEESSCLQRSRSNESLSGIINQAQKRHHKRRRATKRRSFSNPRESDQCESSMEESLKDHMESLVVLRRSDSDDSLDSKKQGAHVLYNRQNVICSVESDSLTENFSPLRPHRRRRKFKRMAVDVEPSDDFVIPMARTFRPKRTKSRSKLDCDDGVEMMKKPGEEDGTEAGGSRFGVMGKRKRTHIQSGSGVENDQDDAMEETAYPWVRIIIIFFQVSVPFWEVSE